MTRNFWTCCLVLPIFFWFSFHFVLQENYRLKQTWVENTVYEYVQLMSKRGRVDVKVLDELYGKLGSQGEFQLFLSAEKAGQGGSGTAPAEILSGVSILGRDLRGEGFDFLSVTVIYAKPHPLTALYRKNFFFGSSGTGTDVILGAGASGYIQ